MDAQTGVIASKTGIAFLGEVVTLRCANESERFADGTKVQVVKCVAVNGVGQLTAKQSLCSGN